MHTQDRGHAPPHWSLELSFFAGVITTLATLGIIGGFAIQSANADTASTSASVTNSLPVASSVSIDAAAGSVTLTENTTTNVTCTATITDNNSCEEITTGSAVFFRTNVAGGSGCSADDNNCYTGITCTVDGGSCTGGGGDLTATYTCTTSVQYFADPTDAGSASEATDWTCEVTPVDGVGNGTVATDTIEMNSLTALDVTSTVAFGTLGLGNDTSATNQTTVVTNTGNEEIDAQISGTAMACTAGSIGVGNQKYDTSDVTYASLTKGLSVTPTTQTLTLPQSTGTAVTDDVYWGLAMPSSGVGGTCAGSNTFTAISG